MTNCKTCTSTSACTSCYSSLLAFEDECVSSCDSGYYSTGVICECKGSFKKGILLTKKACATIDSNCLTCDDSSTCTSCSGTLLAFGDECVSSCESGYYSTGVICECKGSFKKGILLTKKSLRHDRFQLPNLRRFEHMHKLLWNPVGF